MLHLLPAICNSRLLGSFNFILPQILSKPKETCVITVNQTLTLVIALNVTVTMKAYRTRDYLDDDSCFHGCDVTSVVD